MDIGTIEDGDLDTVLDLWARCGLLHPDNDARADIARARRAADATLLVGRQDGRAIATAMVGFDGHRGWVYYLAVEPALQRSGHGKAVLAAAERWLRARKAPKLMLLVAEANGKAMGFYEKLGFTRSPVVALGKLLK
ncbi:MAG TPA: GNAT family acetyltransferase [Alphaproteobacteria bacterium]|nr:GNAT family acetyltransferase [Alphaproteobacteria bacterium]